MRSKLITPWCRRLVSFTVVFTNQFSRLWCHQEIRDDLSKERKSRIMKIAVIGTGYVGLVQGTCLAESGNDVVCVDKVAAKIEGLKNGQVPIYEPGLAELVHRNQRDGRLEFSTNLADGIAEAEIIFIAVGTPQGEQGGADLSGVWEVGRQIAANLRSPKIIVIKSTVPVGTNAELTRQMSGATSIPFDVGSNPEFLKEGAAIDDFNKPDRVVVGVRRRKLPNGCTLCMPHSCALIGHS